VALIVAFAVAVVVAPITARFGRRFGFADRPGPLKVHTEPVPYLGGLAVFAGLAGPLALARPVLIVPLMMSLALGLADDMRAPSAAVRLCFEVVIGVVTALTLPASDLPGGLFTVAAVVGLLNAVNLLDGLDGLASGVCMVSAVGFALVLENEFQVLALATAGSLAGFLVWNRPPARIYLGDGGSYLVGTALAILLAASFTDGEPVALTSGALLFLAVPAADIVVAVVRRLRAGRPMFYGDRGHVYDQLVDRGWHPLATVRACVLAQALLVVIGVAIASLPAAFAVALAATLVVSVGTVLIVAFTTPGTWKTR
jgi:UDP-N-acetylmuramyl pentapeptide phosphotransferase/UDP-N-acetylglucosamine-1-phosphate transferase